MRIGRPRHTPQHQSATSNAQATHEASGGRTRSYQQTLEGIGHYFDRQRYRGIFLAESEDGFVGKAYQEGQGVELYSDGLSFPSSDIDDLVAAVANRIESLDSPSSLLPSGYRSFLGAVGIMCDRSGAGALSILELTNGIVLSLSRQTGVGPDRRPVIERRSKLLDRTGIDDLLQQTGTL